MPANLYFTIFVMITFVACYVPPPDFCKITDRFCGNKKKGLKSLYCGGEVDKKNAKLGKTPENENLEPLRELILDAHNELRNTIACGNPEMVNVGGEVFPKAARLQKLVWDDELEWIAKVNAKACNYGHDCRFTPNYPYAGQNLGCIASPEPMEVAGVMKALIKSWWSEYLNCRTSVILKYSSKDATFKVGPTFTEEEKKKMFIVNEAEVGSIDMVGHFTTLVRETSKLGCAFTSCGPAEDQKYTYYFICNYGKTNMRNEAIYKKSEIAASECKVKSKKYCCLCLEDSDKETADCCHTIDFPLPDFREGRATSPSTSVPCAGNKRQTAAGTAPLPGKAEMGRKVHKTNSSSPDKKKKKRRLCPSFAKAAIHQQNLFSCFMTLLLTYFIFL